jgi:DNA-binding CsgD family transcriptional regulator
VVELALLVEGVAVYRFAVKPPVVMIGRSADNDIHIDDASVSNFHARIELRGEGKNQQIFLEDLNSTNGTFVNKKQIQQAKIQHGDYVSIGRKQFKLFDSSVQAANENDTTVFLEDSSDELDKDQQARLKELGLSPREIQVLCLLGNGKQRKEIAQELSISVHTASDYVKAIYKKMDVSSRDEAVKLAMGLGIIR